jgi:hypothetical protein
LHTDSCTVNGAVPIPCMCTCKLLSSGHFGYIELQIGIRAHQALWRPVDGEWQLVLDSQRRHRFEASVMLHLHTFYICRLDGCLGHLLLVYGKHPLGQVIHFAMTFGYVDVVNGTNQPFVRRTLTARSTSWSTGRLCRRVSLRRSGQEQQSLSATRSSTRYDPIDILD